MEQVTKRAMFALVVGLISATSASALGLDLGGAKADVDIGRDGIHADVEVGGESGLGAEANIGGSGIDADVSLGGTGTTTPGTATPGVPSTTPPVTTAAVTPMVLPYNLAALTGLLVMSSDNRPIGYVEEVIMTERGKPMVRIRILDHLGQSAKVARVVLNRIPPKDEVLQLKMTQAEFLHQL